MKRKSLAIFIIVLITLSSLLSLNVSAPYENYLNETFESAGWASSWTSVTGDNYTRVQDVVYKGDYSLHILNIGLMVASKTIAVPQNKTHLSVYWRMDTSGVVGLSIYHDTDTIGQFSVGYLNSSYVEIILYNYNTTITSEEFYNSTAPTWKICSLTATENTITGSCLGKTLSLPRYTSEAINTVSFHVEAGGGDSIWVDNMNIQTYGNISTNPTVNTIYPLIALFAVIGLAMLMILYAINSEDGTISKILHILIGLIVIGVLLRVALG